MSETFKLSSKKYNAKYSIPLFYLLVSSILETFRTTQTIATVLACSPETDGKTISLMAPHTLITGHGETKLVLTKKIPLSS